MLWSTLAASCKSKPPGDQATAHPAAAGPTPVDRALVQLEDAAPGLTVRLSEGKPGGAAEQRDRVKVAPAAKLAEPEAQRLLSRMPALVAGDQDRKNFALRDKSQPPPRTGKVIKGQFPPPGPGPKPPAARVEGTELKVIRHAPEGEVPLAPHLSVTFNQPMVAITSHADTVAHGVPVVLTPQPPGKWRWIGSKTLLFDPDVRFPAATQYTVEIAAGVRSASGAVLRKPVKFIFGTPPPSLTQMWPQSGQAQRRDPLLFAAFDQKIDREAVLASIQLKADGRSTAVRAATSEEIDKDATVKSLIDAEDKAEHQGRYVAFKPVALLPGDQQIEVAVGPGTPSAEGPRRSTSAQGWSFRTFGPLRVVEWRCSYGANCPPGTPFMFRLSNPLDEEAFDQSTLRIEPELPGLKTVVSGEWLTIVGRQKGRTTYKVTLPASLRDQFEQTLGKEETRSFRVGDAFPQLFGASGLTLLDPSSKKPTYSLHSINVPSLDVEIYRVSPDDWSGFIRFMEKNPRKPVPPPGKKVFDRTIKPAGTHDEMIETPIDLGPALSASGKGHAVVVIKPTHWPDRYKPELDAWVEATEIALDAFVDSGELLAWATRLKDGAPMEGVEVALQGTRGATGARGTAALALPEKSRARQMLIGRKGDDVAFLPENTYAWSEVGGWRKQKQDAQLSWFVYDDRAMYRPGEEVHLKGWLRVLDTGEGGDVMGLAGQVDDVSYKVIGPRGNDLTSGKAQVSALGGFDAAFTLPTTPNLGAARVEFSARGKKAGAFTHAFQIQEFRRPEYEVSATASEGPHLVGRGADIAVKAAYYAGGGLASADVVWQVSSSPTSFTPPGRDGYVFGSFEPWWTHRYDQPEQPRLDTLAGKTDATGQHILHIDFLSIKPPRPMSLVAQAMVQDVNRQAWAASSVLLVHPSDLYVGLKQDRYFVDKGQPIEVGAIAVDHDGKAAPGTAIDMKAVRLDWTYKKGEFKEEEADPQACSVVAAEKDQTCQFDTPEGGTYRITATVKDRAGRPNQSQILVWVSGGDVPPVRNVAQQEAMLVPDAKEYHPGGKARLMVQSPFFPAHGLLSIRRSGIVETRSFEMKSATTTLEVPISEAHVPNLTVQVDLVGSAPRVTDAGKPDDRLPRRPAYAVGSIVLPVPPVTRTLKLAVAPRAAKIEPGGRTQVDVAVKDASGRPVSGAELSVVVVDEAVL
ncbi:MAG TPA: Ig-like domain-containing protein, partial [Kofleriaceae bacterium]|nr:Ig-like domain-containing protein [Kofleriaceae bacterium]